VSLDTVPDAGLREATDAVVRVLCSCICGSDIWAYRGIAKRSPGQPIGHEFVGVVDAIGSEVRTLRPGDVVVAPFFWCDGTCVQCARGVPTSCIAGGFWGRSTGADGGQAEAVRVPHADGTLVAVDATEDDERLPALLTLADVMGTGLHAAKCAEVGPGDVVAVVGDGAVGLCGVLAARRLGAERVIMLGRNDARLAIARRFGATDVVRHRGAAAAEGVRELTAGLGADRVLECVGTEESIATAIAASADGGTVGYVGVPHGVLRAPIREMFGRSVALRGGIAPVRRYIPELVGDVLHGDLDPSPVFDVGLPLAAVEEGYATMDARLATKVLLRC